MIAEQPDRGDTVDERRSPRGAGVSPANAVAIISCLQEGPGWNHFHSSKAPDPGMRTASECAANLSLPGTGGVARRRRDGVGPSPFPPRRLRRGAGGEVPLAVPLPARDGVGPLPFLPLRLRRGAYPPQAGQSEMPFASPLPEREGWPAAGGTG